jgi:hypothetical protein
VSRIIQVDSVGKERARLTKSIVLALRELARQPEIGNEALDLCAFISLALKHISDGIDPSVSAWEKRGYWVKADRFRMEWAWAGQYAMKMRASLLSEDWSSVALLAAQIGERFRNIQVSARPQSERPWAGAYTRLQATD